MIRNFGVLLSLFVVLGAGCAAGAYPEDEDKASIAAAALENAEAEMGPDSSSETCAAACEYCWPSVSECSPSYIGAGDGCDCGCGVVDPDCGGGASTEPPAANACGANPIGDINGDAAGNGQLASGTGEGWFKFKMLETTRGFGRPLRARLLVTESDSGATVSVWNDCTDGLAASRQLGLSQEMVIGINDSWYDDTSDVYVRVVPSTAGGSWTISVEGNYWFGNATAGGVCTADGDCQNGGWCNPSSHRCEAYQPIK